MMQTKSKKGIAGLEKFVLSLVVIGFTLVIGLTLLAQVRDTDPRIGSVSYCGTNITGGTGTGIQWTNCSVQTNASIMTISALEQVPGWLSIIVLATIAVIILGVIYMLKKRG